MGHPLRRPTAGAARGKGRAGAPAPRARDPRDLARRRQPRGDRHGQPANAGDELRAGRPGRLPAHEDDPGWRRPSRLPGDRGPDPDDPEAPGNRPAGSLALLDRPHGRRLHLGRDPALLRPYGDIKDARAANPVPRRLPARLSSAPGRCIRSRSRSPSRSSARPRTRSSSPRRSWRRSPTAAAST